LLEKVFVQIPRKKNSTQKFVDQVQKMNSLKRLIPKDPTDRIGLSMALFFISIVTINDLIALYNQSLQNFTYSFIIFFISIFVLFNLLGNMYRAMSIDTSIDSLELTNILLPEWNFCSACELNAPPRAYHCMTCQKCILKRHNHCMFLGKCIGYNNFRFYILFIFYVWLGTFVNNFINMNYFLNLISEFGFKTLLCTFVPWLAWLIGFVSLGEMLFIIPNSICLFLSILMMFYFGINLSIAFNGQTWHERSKNINIYKQNFKESFIEIFGYNWFFSVVNPFALLKLPGNGTKFKKCNQLNSNQIESEQYQFNENLLKRRFV
jgi:palmitoyltransferase